MNLLKTSFLNGIAVAVKVATALILNKVLAVYVGPAGYAIIGQFQNAVSIIVSLAGGVMATGVTKATAQHFDDEAKQHTVWQTGIRLSLAASIITAIPLMFMGDTLARFLLNRAEMSSIFVWLALTLPAMAANNMLLAIVNGKKEVGIYVTANIIGNLISMLLVGLLAYNFGLHGALIAFVINPAIMLLVTAAIVSRSDWFQCCLLWGKINRPVLRELSGFAMMGLTSALTSPISYMLIRDNLTNSLGLSAAGIWQASWKISEIYLMLVTSTLSFYYLPRLAEIRDARDLKTEIIKVYRFVMPIVALGAATIYLLRDFIINALFTTDFSSMRELFPWQLTGDVIKIGSWILGYILLGRAMVKFFIVTEIAFAFLFVLLSWYFVSIFGLIGVAIAYTTNYLCHSVCMVFLIRYEFRKMRTSNDQF